MRKHQTHVCLVSHQTVPNLTPLMDPLFKPRAVIFVVSDDMREQMTWLASIIQPRGIKITTWALDDAWDIHHIYERLWQLLEQHAQEDLVLNASGGTKPMSIAAYEAFRDHQKPIFYVHPEKDRVMWLYPDRKTAFNLDDRIKIPDLLKAHGATMQTSAPNTGIPQNIRTLTDLLVQEVETYHRALASMNYLASKAQNSPHLAVTMERHYAANSTFQQLLDLFEQERLITVRGNQLRFEDETARFFANGGWLEEYVYGVIYGLRKQQPKIQDVKRGVVVTRENPKGTTKNELDVVFIADNRLYIIECKTLKWRDAHDDGQGAQALYKLDTLKELLGGLHGRAMLVSYQPIREADRIRASDLRIQTCAGREIQQLTSSISRWI